MTDARLRRYSDACDGLVLNVRLAADPHAAPWGAYVGSRVGLAVWFARYCAHEARALGLWP